MKMTDDAKKTLAKHSKDNRRQIDVLCQECKEVMTVGKPKILTKARYMCLDCHNQLYCVELVRESRAEKKVKLIQDDEI